MCRFEKISQSRILYENKGVFPIWYVLHCEEGKEKEAADLLQQRYGCSDKAEIFLITFEKMKRYEGRWHCLEEVLFRGFVFVDAESRERLEEAAHGAAVFRSFRKGEYSLCLEEAEKEFLEDVGGEAHRIVMSKGYIRDGVPFVTEGPLRGKERRIRKIDRHKRMARVDSPLECCRKGEFWMGLEITVKS